MDSPKLPTICQHISIIPVSLPSSLQSINNTSRQMTNKVITYQQPPERDKCLRPISLHHSTTDILSSISSSASQNRKRRLNYQLAKPTSTISDISVSMKREEFENDDQETQLIPTHIHSDIYSTHSSANGLSYRSLPSSITSKCCTCGHTCLGNQSYCHIIAKPSQKLEYYIDSKKSGALDDFFGNRNNNNSNSNGGGAINNGGKDDDDDEDDEYDNANTSKHRNMVGDATQIKPSPDPKKRHLNNTSNINVNDTRSKNKNSLNNSVTIQSNLTNPRQSLHTELRVKPEKKCCFCWCGCCTCSWLPVQPNRNDSVKNRESKIDSLTLCESEPLTYKEVTSWGQSFDRLMKTSNGRNTFRDFLRHEYSEENMLFWLACEELKKEQSQEAIEEKARLIYEDYISILSPKEVSLDSRVREIINKKMVDPSKDTFDEAQIQIYTLMHRDSYPRFLNSAFYKNIKDQYRNVGSDKV